MSRALGRYELLRPLARGGMGEVYLARRRAAGVEKWLVVKRMRPERAGDTRFLDLFMREARLSMSLAHQNIVPVFDFGRIDDQVFLAMERVEGKDLGSSLAKSGKAMPPLLAAFIAGECCKGLDYAHRRKSPEGTELGIVHRDVTPRNVLLSWSGEVKLTDFGIAALAGDEPSKMAGTPAYMAPEQARGEATDVRADIYAVGIVLREALTGVRPRRGDNRETVLAAAQVGKLDPWPDDFSSPLREIVDRATAIAKEDRYTDARSMLEQLDGFIVTERAAKKSDAPERQLAAWLADVWHDAREDEPITGDIEANQLLSFLDDGPFDVVGTGTERSMAATAAEDLAKPNTEVSLDRAPTTDVTIRPLRRSRLLVVLGIVIVAAGALMLAFTLGRREEPPKQPVAVVQPVDAAVRAAEPHPPPIPEPETEGSGFIPGPGAVDPAVPDAAVPDAPRDAAPPRPHPKQTKIAPKKTEPLPVVAAPTFKVFVNTTPNWSNYTIDDDPQQYQTPNTVRLTAGPHKLHFTGSEYHPVAAKTEPITVPDRDGSKFILELKAPTP